MGGSSGKFHSTKPCQGGQGLFHQLFYHDQPSGKKWYSNLRSFSHIHLIDFTNSVKGARRLARYHGKYDSWMYSADFLPALHTESHEACTLHQLILMSPPQGHSNQFFLWEFPENASLLESEGGETWGYIGKLSGRLTGGLILVSDWFPLVTEFVTLNITLLVWVPSLTSHYSPSAPPNP